MIKPKLDECWDNALMAVCEWGYDHNGFRVHLGTFRAERQNRRPPAAIEARKQFMAEEMAAYNR